MKSFLRNNWYRLMTASAFLVFSFGFLVFVLKYNTAKAGIPDNHFANKPPGADNNFWIVGCNNGIYEVTYNKAFGRYTSTLIGPKRQN